MTQKEFEERTGVSMTATDFEQVHDIYMACGDGMDKDEFCALWKDKQFCALLNRVTAEKKITEEAYGMAMDEISRTKAKKSEREMELVEILLGKSCAYNDTDLYDEAVRLIGQKEVVIAKLRLELPLWDSEKVYVFENLK